MADLSKEKLVNLDLLVKYNEKIQNKIPKITQGSNINITTPDPTKPNEITISSDVDVFTKSGTNANKGLVPTPPITSGTNKYLCEDGTWQIPDAARFQKTTGVGYFSVGDSTCDVNIPIPDNNYSIQVYGTNSDIVIKNISVGTNIMTISMGKQLTAGAIYVVTTEAEYPSNVNSVITGVGTYSVGDSKCDITMNIPTGNYVVSTYTTDQNVYINNITHTGTTLTVNFFRNSSSAGSVYAFARKVD